MHEPREQQQHKIFVLGDHDGHVDGATPSPASAQQKEQQKQHVAAAAVDMQVPVSAYEAGEQK